ncbi:HNH endonuclease [Spirosoma flavum]|uniref:HNH endonuclease n=1 Tax=Spirosoma flavum TaxID=2048557 RepID=A0ABW6AUC7_9BACT
MKQSRKSYYNSKWFEFSKQVKNRDGFKCLKCHRRELETTLQVHHKHYIPKLLPWDYALSDCITLCKGCHAREHNKIEPTTGWVLISVDDLGGLDGICERRGCGKELRFEHLIYHPSWGYIRVGSSCLEYLTQEDQILSAGALRIYKRISDFIHKTNWKTGVTRNDNEYIYAKYKHHILRIYGNVNFAFQIGLKQKGERRHIYGEIFQAYGKNLLLSKELGFIALIGTTSESEQEKEVLKNIYRSTRDMNTL